MLLLVLKRLLWSVLLLFVLLNIIAVLHAWHFTHFALPGTARTPSAELLSFRQKLRIAFTGVSMPKPVTQITPDVPFEKISLPDGTEGWWIPAAEASGTVILAHGYGGEKSSMLGRALYFRKRGFHTFLIDLSGAGASGKNTTTIGFKEALQIGAAVKFTRARQAGKLFLFGTSMGAAAIMRAVAVQGVEADGLLLECPFSTMYQTVCQRFRLMGIPEFPMTGLLTFWGGALHGFNAFDHNPVAYARAIHLPVLLLRGAHDPLVTQAETEKIASALSGEKELFICPDGGHADFLTACPQAWEAATGTFLSSH